MRASTTLLLICLFSMPLAQAFAKDHSYDIERAQAAAANGEPTRAKAILKQVLRKDPQDQAAKEALEDLIHPPKTPTRTPTPRPSKVEKPAKAEKPKTKAKPSAAPKAPTVKAKPAPKAAAAPKAAPAEAPKPSFFQRFKARVSGLLHREKPVAQAPADNAAKIKPALPCQTISYVHFGQKRSGKLLEDLPQTKELVVAYNKGKATISRDQVIKTEDCFKK